MKAEMLQSGLLTCPFCGGKPSREVETIDDGDYTTEIYFIKCVVCGARTRGLKSNDIDEMKWIDSEIAWNLRK